jgi:membrane-associated progesterone receptor component
MLTDIDKPLDKLDDLRPEEIENMRGWCATLVPKNTTDYDVLLTGWSEHFTNKYIVCGKLVEEGSI